MKLSIRSCGWAVLAAVGLAGQASDYVSARKLFYAEPEPTPAPVKREPAKTSAAQKSAAKDSQRNQGTVRVATAAVVPGLRYKLIQEVGPGLELAADPDRTFRSRDKLRFEFESNIDGYLYVVQQGSSGNWSVLFPDARINGGTNRIERRRPLQVPVGTWYVFNDTPGTERILVFLSKAPLRDLPGMARPDALPTTVEESVVEELNNSLRARELVFEKDPEGTPAAAPGGSVYAVNNGPGGEAVVVTMTLKHMQTRGAALPQEGSASTIFHRKTGYGLRISVELKRDHLVRTVSPNFAFRTGDQIRLHFTSNFDGYVYALNEAANGRIRVIFPSQETGSNNLIRNAQDYVIPATKGWFRMAGESGEERVHMVISPRSLPELGKLGDTAEVNDDPPPSAARAPQDPVQAGAVHAPASPSVVTPPGAAPSRASADSQVEEKVQNGASTVPNVPRVPEVPSVRAQVPNPPPGTTNPVDRAQKKVEKKVGKVRSGIALGEEIRRLPGDIIRVIPRLRSKDLVLQDDVQERASYVTTLPSSPGAAGEPVTFTIVLVH